VEIVVKTDSGIAVASLDDPDDFEHFEVRIVEIELSVAQTLLKTIAVLESDHAFVEPAGLLLLEGARPENSQWLSQFREMAEYARTRGWVDEKARIRAHIVWK
jgi:hypothetical protein